MSLFPPQRRLRSGSRCTTPHPWLVRCWHTGLGAQKEPSGMIASATPRRWLLNHQHTPNSKQFKTAAYSKCCSKLKLWFIDHHFTLPSDPRRCTIRSGDENSWIWVNVQIEHSDLSGPPWLSLCRGHAYPHPIFPSHQKKQQQPKNENWKTYSGRISKQHELSRFVKPRRLHHDIILYPHRSPSFAVSPISGEYPTLFAQHWLFLPRYLTENFALRHLIEAYETQLAEKRHRFFMSPVRIKELWWHYQPVICSIWGFP